MSPSKALRIFDARLHPQITREVGYSPSQITRLIRDYQEYGLDAFIAMPHTGKRKYATHKSNFILSYRISLL